MRRIDITCVIIFLTVTISLAEGAVGLGNTYALMTVAFGAGSLLGLYMPVKVRPVVPLSKKSTESDDAQKETHRYEMLSQVAGLIVHDLATPLMSLDYCIDEILRDPSRAKSEDIKELLRISSKSNLGLVSALRAFVKGSGGRGVCSLREGVESTARIIWMKHMTGGVEAAGFELGLTISLFGLEMDLKRMNFDEMDMDLEVDMDLGDLIHVLVNLLSNAVDASRSMVSEMRRKGSVGLLIGPGGDGELVKFLRFDIIDDGPGLSPTDFDRLTKGRGSGSMGMKLVRGLIESKGGEIKVGTAEGGGTRICVWLPANGEGSRRLGA